MTELPLQHSGEAMKMFQGQLKAQVGKKIEGWLLLHAIPKNQSQIEYQSKFEKQNNITFKIKYRRTSLDIFGVLLHFILSGFAKIF